MFQNLWVHVGDDPSGSLGEDSPNPLCAHFTGGADFGATRSRTDVACAAGPMRGRYLDLRTRRPAAAAQSGSGVLDARRPFHLLLEAIVPFVISEGGEGVPVLQWCVLTLLREMVPVTAIPYC